MMTVAALVYFQDKFMLTVPNVWAALMKFVVDLLVMLYVVCGKNNAHCDRVTLRVLCCSEQHECSKAHDCLIQDQLITLHQVLDPSTAACSCGRSSPSGCCAFQ